MKRLAREKAMSETGMTDVETEVFFGQVQALERLFAAVQVLHWRGRQGEAVEAAAAVQDALDAYRRA